MVSRKNDCGWQVEALDVNLCMSVQRARGLVEALNSFQRSRPSKFTKFNRLESNLDLDSHSCKFFREMLHARTQVFTRRSLIFLSTGTKMRLKGTTSLMPDSTGPRFEICCLKCLARYKRNLKTWVSVCPGQLIRRLWACQAEYHWFLSHSCKP
jgi:hypothetical protein